MQVLCGLCHPYSAHLFERLDTMDGLTMTNEFCNEFFSACESELALASDYCDIHTGGDVDQYWSYPLVIDGESVMHPRHVSTGKIQVFYHDPSCVRSIAG